MNINQLSLIVLILYNIFTMYLQSIYPYFFLEHSNFIFHLFSVTEKGNKFGKKFPCQSNSSSPRNLGMIKGVVSIFVLENVSDVSKTWGSLISGKSWLHHEACIVCWPGCVENSIPRHILRLAIMTLPTAIFATRQVGSRRWDQMSWFTASAGRGGKRQF